MIPVPIRASLAPMLLAVLVAMPAAAQEPPPPPVDTTLGQQAARTATYQAMSSFNDFIYGVAFGGGIAAGGLLAAASLVTEPIIHFLHETAWGEVAPPADADAAMRRVPVRAATYSLANAGRVFASSWLITGNPVVALGMVAFNAVGDSIVYAANDAAWLHFGQSQAPAVGSAGAP
ncbi:putative membrane protein DUF2061 [Stella humosa]|uniref:Putative membrane protein DUF2061 n=1 Tax=Stella humosa TaxID=94 RepID=A0A3N1MF03_9PROT|nr:DUF2061 domain-containing protein [Stella humosa]ROP99755.1 putative membrane protein DUF2061 [Stella humosa]BBK31018.1 hypothetical protein STHU_16520 [Stella humosa]